LSPFSASELSDQQQTRTNHLERAEKNCEPQQRDTYFLEQPQDQAHHVRGRDFQKEPQTPSFYTIRPQAALRVAQVFFDL